MDVRQPAPERQLARQEKDRRAEGKRRGGVRRDGGPLRQQCEGDRLERPEHDGPVPQRLGQGVGAEQHPAEQHHRQAIEVPQAACAHRLRRGAEREALQHQERAVEQAPAQECPRRAMPQSGGREHDQQVAVGRERAAAVAAEREIEIVAEPGAEGHVPAAPELGDRAAGIGPEKILGEADAEHPRQADRHVRIAGEVEIDLQGIGDGADPGAEEVLFARGQTEHRIGDRRDIVGDDDLLGEAVGEARHAGGEVLDRDARLNHVPDHIAEADDRPGDQVREEALVGGIAGEAPVGFDLAAPHVHQIGDRLEHEERDAGGQSDLLGDPTETGAKNQVEVFRNEMRILEPEQRREIDQDQDRQGQARAGAREPERTGVVDDDDRDQDEGPCSLRPVVEGEADQEDGRQERPAPQQQHDRQRHGQEDEQEIGRRKDQAKTPPHNHRAF